MTEHIMERPRLSMKSTLRDIKNKVPLRKLEAIDLRRQLLDILNNKEKCIEFQNFLKSRRCEENINYYFDVELFKNETETPNNMIEKRADELIGRYFDPVSPYQLNFDEELITQVFDLRKVNCSREMFNETENAVLKLMETDCLVKFKDHQQVQETANISTKETISRGNSVVQLFRSFSKRTGLKMLSGGNKGGSYSLTSLESVSLDRVFSLQKKMDDST